MWRQGKARTQASKIDGMLDTEENYYLYTRLVQTLSW